MAGTQVSIQAGPSEVHESPPDRSMFLVLPVPFRFHEGVLYCESQAANGLRCWSDNFSRIDVAAPVIPEALLYTQPGMVWKPVTEIVSRGSLNYVQLPWAYGPGAFIAQQKPMRRLFRDLIRKNQYLQFAIGGLIGDWPALAALVAIGEKRRFAIHTDRVEHEVVMKVVQSAPFRRRLKAGLEAPLMKRYHRYLIQKCSLGLWHGADCYQAYSPWCTENHLIHDVHTNAADNIDEETLNRKLETLTSEPVVQICYAGRLDPMKAPADWVKAIGVARQEGASIKAVWYGEGPLRAEAEVEVRRLGLEDIVSFPGFLSDRAAILERLRASHIMVFTHVTPESPRCLLESLISGTPIVGYKSDFADELTTGFGGGVFVPIGGWKELGHEIAKLASGRQQLRELILKAARNGARFNDQAVFAHRSELIQRFC